jgi:DNA-binding beta-propeller fold protein YncE
MGFHKVFSIATVSALSAFCAVSEVMASAREPIAGSGYHLIRTVALPGDETWDHLTLDQDSRRLYVTRKDCVQVLDADSLNLVGTVKGTPNCHVVVALEALGKGYVSCSAPGSVVVFDLKSLTRLAEVATSKDTDALMYDAAWGKLIAFNADGRNATIIDPATDRVVDILDLGGAPETAVTDGKGRIFDNLKDKSEVIRISKKTMKIDRRWPLAPGEFPASLALDVEHNRLFVGCRNKLLVVMDSNNGAVIQTLPIGKHVDTTIFDPKTGTIFNSCGNGTLAVVHEDNPDKYSVVEYVATENDAKTMAFDPVTGRIFLTTARTQTKPMHGTANPEEKVVVPGTFHVLAMGKQ